MTLSVYLSEDLQTWEDSFTNGIPFSTIVEQPQFSLRRALKLGSLQSNNLRITISGTPAQCSAFIAYKYIKVLKGATVAFVGSLTTYNRKAITATLSEIAVQYNDLSDYWKDALFCEDPRQAFLDGDAHASDIGVVSNKQSEIDSYQTLENQAYSNWQSTGSEISEDMYYTFRQCRLDLQNDVGSGKYAWEWAIIKSDNIKVCDPANTSKSLVHLIADYLPFSSSLSVQCSVTRSEIVQAFRVSSKKGTTTKGYYGKLEGDKVLDTLLNVCAQNAINVTLDGLTLKFTDAYITAGTATSVVVETNASKTDKPYKKNKYSDIEYFSKTLSRTTCLWSATITSTRDDRFFPEYGETPLPCSWVAKLPEASSLISVSPKRVNGHVDIYAKLSDMTGISYWNGDTYVHCSPYAWSQYMQEAELRIYADNVPSWIQWLVGTYTMTLYVDGTYTVALYENTLKTGGESSGEVSRYPYIFSTESAGRYDIVRRWYDEADTAYWTFSTNADLQLGQAIALSGVDSEVLIVTSKTDTLDEFGNCVYTASRAINSASLSVDSQFVQVDTSLLDGSRAIDVQCNKPVIVTNAEGTPKSEDPARIIIASDDGQPPTLEVDGVAVELKQEGVVIGENVTLKNVWYYDVPMQGTMANAITYTVTLQGATRQGKIEIVADGQDGTSGDGAEYLGVLYSAPADAHIGDYYVFGLCGHTGTASLEGTIYEKTEEGWQEMDLQDASNTSKVLTAYADILAKRYDTNYFSAPPTANDTITHVTALLADAVVADKLKATTGFFDNITSRNITITGNSVFSGSIESDAITTHYSDDTGTIWVDTTTKPKIGHFSDAMDWVAQHTADAEWYAGKSTGGQDVAEASAYIPVSNVKYDGNTYSNGFIIYTKPNTYCDYKLLDQATAQAGGSVTCTIPFACTWKVTCYGEWDVACRHATSSIPYIEEYNTSYFEGTYECRRGDRWTFTRRGTHTNPQVNLRVNTSFFSSNIALFASAETYTYTPIWLDSYSNVSKEWGFTISGDTYRYAPHKSFRGVPLEDVSAPLPMEGSPKQDGSNSFYYMDTDLNEYEGKVTYLSVSNANDLYVELDTGDKLTIPSGWVVELRMRCYIVRGHIYSAVRTLRPAESHSYVGSASDPFPRAYITETNTTQMNADTATVTELKRSGGTTVVDSDGKVWGAVFN